MSMLDICWRCVTERVLLGLWLINQVEESVPPAARRALRRMVEPARWYTHQKARRAYNLLAKQTRKATLFTFLDPTLDKQDHHTTYHYQRARRRYKRHHQNPDLQPPRTIRAPHEKSRRMVVLPPQRIPTQTPPPKTRTQTRGQTTKTRPETMGQNHRLQPQIPRRIPAHPQKLGSPIPPPRHARKKTHKMLLSPKDQAADS